MFSDLSPAIVAPGRIGRRECLRLTAAAVLAGRAASAVAAAADEKADPARRIFVTGGGLLSGDPQNRLLRFIVSLTGKPDPVVCLLPTASGDNLERLAVWYEIMNDLPCRPRHLRLFGPTAKARNFEKQLSAADAIVVPGGNAVNMVAVWKAQGVDAVLRAAWQRGILLAGESAGMNCWFEQGVGDSRPERLSAIDFLGWLKGSSCPHYHDESAPWRTSYRELIAAGEIKDGIACDSGAGVLFEGDRPTRVVSISPQSGAYRVRRSGNDVIEERLAAELLEPAP